MAGRDLSVFVTIGGKLALSLADSIKKTQSRLTSLVHDVNAKARAVGQAFSGLGGALAAAGIAASVKKAIDAADEYNKHVIGLQNSGLSMAEIARGTQAAWKVIADVPSAKIADVVGLLNETKGAFGSYEHAVEHLKFTTKLDEVMKGAFGWNEEEARHQTVSLVKFLEQRDAMLDPKRFEREAENIERSMTLFGGNLKADDFLKLATQFKSGLNLLSEKSCRPLRPRSLTRLAATSSGRP